MVTLEYVRYVSVLAPLCVDSCADVFEYVMFAGHLQASEERPGLQMPPVMSETLPQCSAFPTKGGEGESA